MRPNQYLKHFKSGSWLVQFGYVNNKWLANKFFSGAKYKNPRAAAVRFRNAEIKRLNYPTDMRAKSIKSETNVPGLSIAESRTKNSIGFFWQASYRGSRKWFSIRRHGYINAFHMALRWRRDRTNEKYQWQRAPTLSRPELIEWLKAKGIKF